MQYRACGALLAPHRGQMTADIPDGHFDDALGFTIRELSLRILFDTVLSSV
jgi:hypothetical protein